MSHQRGYRKLLVSRDRIVMPADTAVTLNGIAQGYITDKVVDLLRADGIDHSLVDMGETGVIARSKWPYFVEDAAALP